MWELDHKEGWALKNGYFWTLVLEKTLQSPLDSKEIKPVSPKGNQPWIFIGRTDAEAPILWPPDAECNSLEKTAHPGKDSRKEKKRLAASLIQLTWTWPNAERWWGTGRPGMLQSMGLQRVRTDCVIEQLQMKVTTKNLGKYFPF